MSNFKAIPKNPAVNNHSVAAKKPKDIQKIADEGLAGASRPLPHYSLIKSAFGNYNIDHIQAYTNPQAQTASKAINAEAYATKGNKIAFADSNPDLHTVAHEVTHVIQQQNGVHLKSSVGQVGDIYEQQADAVADAVVSKKDISGLLGSISTPAIGGINLDGEDVNRNSRVENSNKIALQAKSNNQVQRKIIHDNNEYTELSDINKKVKFENNECNNLLKCICEDEKLAYHFKRLKDIIPFLKSFSETNPAQK